MGSFVNFRCRFCGYDQSDIAVGQGKDKSLKLKFFSCDNCKSVGSTWCREGQQPRCTFCYHEGITLLPEDVRQMNCPKCGEPVVIVPGEGGWE